MLGEVAAGRSTPAAALEKLRVLPFEEIEEILEGAPGGAPFARLDHHRLLRVGLPEAVFGEGKTQAQVAAICGTLAQAGRGFLVTRADPATRRLLASMHPHAEVNDAARTVLLRGRESDSAHHARGTVMIVSAGTADMPVAEEAAVTAAAFGNPVERLYDVGVAGLHRVLGRVEDLRRAAVIIVVAGMEGALPSVIGGLVAAPVIAVPTSVGYGASFSGVAALLGMLNSCAAGVSVVNIDNGFGAACAATRINRADVPNLDETDVEPPSEGIRSATRTEHNP